MSNNGVRSLIVKSYEIMAPEDMFTKAKEYSWQTFFHHSASVASIAYRIASLVKKGAKSVQAKIIEDFEENLGIKFEDFLFYVGLAHDYSKLYSRGALGEEKAKRIIGELLKYSLLDSRAEEVVSKVIEHAKAVEAGSALELETTYIEVFRPIVKIADDLMSLRSVDEAISYIYSSREVEKLNRDCSVRFGFIKVPAPSILQAKISSNVVELVRKRGWVPLVLYGDGLIVAGSTSAQQLGLEELHDAIKAELNINKIFEETLEEAINGLKRRTLARIYRLLIQTGGNEELSVSKPDDAYHNLVVMYLHGVSLTKLQEYLDEQKKKFRKTTNLIDPRTLATGWRGSGSRYFDEELVYITKPEAVKQRYNSLDEEARFLLLSYMVAFASKYVSKTVEILRRALGISLLDTLSDELIRIVAIAEVYRNLGNADRLIEACFSVLSDRAVNFDFYIKRFMLTNIKSNIIDSGGLGNLDVLSSRQSNYCRICGSPLHESAISFSMYGMVIGGGASSEIWLHDDPPLASLEDIATNKGTMVRYICPICFYEARQIKKGFKPPFLVIALHPVVAYDIWEYVRDRASTMVNLYMSKENPNIAKVYECVLKEGLKITNDIMDEISRLKGRTRATEEETTLIVDDLGARILVPMGGDASMKRKFAALALALVPFAMSACGGGQIGVVAALADVCNLGVGDSPVVASHHLGLVQMVIRPFEAVKRQKRHMTPDDYAVYSLSYLTLLEVLYIYGLKFFSFYALMRRSKKRNIKLEDYALEFYEFITSLPYVTFTLDAPPPERLDPRTGDEQLPYSQFISEKLEEVESRMSQASKVVEGGEKPSLTKLVYRYAVNLRELDPGLSRYKVQRPLRDAIDVLLQYARAVGEEEAKRLAREAFLMVISKTLNVDVESKTKRKKDKEGREVEVNYAKIFSNIFNKLANLLLGLRREMNPTHFNNLIELVLDSAYYKYMHAKAEAKK